MTHQRTCDRQTLFLSSGKIASLLLNYRVQSAFSIKNNFIGLRRMDRLFQFLLCGIFISPQQIFTDRTRKQHRFLQYNADLAAQLLQIIGTLHSNTLVSSVLMLVGNLGMSLTLDYVFYGTFSLLRAAGILLILLGMTWVEKEKHAPAESEE